MSNLILFEMKNSVAHITLNDPGSMNTIAVESVDAMHEVLDNKLSKSDVRAVLIRGNGPCFCAGGNVKNMQSGMMSAPDNPMQKLDDFITNMEAMMAKVYRIPLPTIAAVHGSVAGAGIGLMMACDIILVADSAKLSTAYTKIGLSPDGGTSYFLPRSIGTRKTLELFYISEFFSAQTALEMGMINHVVPEADLVTKATGFAESLAQGPTLAYAKAKRLVHETMDNSLQEQFDIERPLIIESFMTNDFVAGATAFLKKEKPHFTGK